MFSIDTMSITSNIHFTKIEKLEKIISIQSPINASFVAKLIKHVLEVDL